MKKVLYTIIVWPYMPLIFFGVIVGVLYAIFYTGFVFGARWFPRFDKKRKRAKK